jgi:hypothetical protein
MDQAEAVEKIVAALTKKAKSKSKFYFNDLAKILGEKPIKGKGKQAHGEGEEEE